MIHTKRKSDNKTHPTPLSQALLSAWYIIYIYHYVWGVSQENWVYTHAASQITSQYHWGSWHLLQKYVNMALTKNNFPQPKQPSSHRTSSHVSFCNGSKLTIQLLCSWQYTLAPRSMHCINCTQRNCSLHPCTSAGTGSWGLMRGTVWGEGQEGPSHTNWVCSFINSKWHLQREGEEFWHTFCWREAWNSKPSARSISKM